MEGQIRKERQKAIYDQKERQRHFWEIVIGSILSLIIIGAGAAFLWLVISRKKVQEVSDLGLTILQNSGIV
jgi:hypothetical protein